MKRPSAQAFWKWSNDFTQAWSDHIWPLPTHLSPAYTTRLDTCTGSRSFPSLAITVRLWPSTDTFSGQLTTPLLMKRNL